MDSKIKKKQVVSIPNFSWKLIQYQLHAYVKREARLDWIYNNLIRTGFLCVRRMEYAQSTPSLSQTQRMKRLSREGKLTKEKMEDIMSEIKKGEISRVIFTNEQLHRYFPTSYTPEKMKWETYNTKAEARKRKKEIEYKQVPGGVDPELLGKVLADPEMTALLAAMAKTMR